MTSDSTPAGARSLPAATTSRFLDRLKVLYADRAEPALELLLSVLARHPVRRQAASWSERDVVLITYGDQVQAAGTPALPALREFLSENQLFDLINTVHVLPFCPFSSDDGFSVIDYRSVDSRIGGWSDFRELAGRCHLMFDLVLNHCSQQSQWFKDYREGREPYSRFFLEADPSQDLSQVTRPRSLPLLTPFETSNGLRHVWTTFSADQVDLNFAEPVVLAEFIDILLFYVEMGARIVRLDAIAYLWKEVGTTCIHLPQTHQVVKLMRDVLEAVAPHVLLLTETNVPHPENVSYFGDGDEAHMVYQFSLPPLLLDAFLSHDATALRDWLGGLDTTPAGTTFFNFTASHDGVGVRPLEGLISSNRIERLVEAARQRGSLIGTKRNPDGTDTPYELNVSYVDALGDPGAMDTTLHARRFLSSQAIMLALPGVPGIYFHSLVGTRNDYDGARESGIPRRINRRKYELGELREVLGESASLQSRIFLGYQRMLRARVAQPAFHPDGGCAVVETGDPAVVAFERWSCDNSQRILCLTNLSPHHRSVDVSTVGTELLSQEERIEGSTNIEPYQTMWIAFR